MKTRIFLIICLIIGIAVDLSANEKIYICLLYTSDAADD